MTTLVTNNAFGTLAANINSASSTITVQTGQGAAFPAPGTNEQAFFTLISASTGAVEIVKYTSRTSDSFTGLTRGSDGTTAQSFVIGDALELRVVAANYNADGILPNQNAANGKFLKSVSLVATWTQIANTDVTGLGTLSTQNGTFSGTSSGTNTGDQTITLTTDVTGSGTGSFVATIANNVVTLAKMATLATARFLGRVTAGTGNVEALTAAQVKTALAIVPADVTGLATVASSGNAGDLTGTLSTAQLPALSGDISTSAGSGVTNITANAVGLGDLAQVTSSTVLGRSTAGTGNVEVLTALPSAVMPALTGDVTTSAGSLATTIANNVVSLAKMATVATATFLGRNTAGTGNVEAMTATQAKSSLAIAQADVSGLTTASAPTFAGATLTGDVAMGNNDITGNKTVLFNSQFTVATTTGAVTVDFNNGQKQKLTQTGNVTLTLTFPAVGHYQLVAVHGAFTVTWPTIGSTFQWLGATAAPSLNTGTYGGVVNFFYDGTMTLASYTKIGA